MLGSAATATRSPGQHRAVPPHVYFVASAAFHYLGPAFAVLLFTRVDVLGVAWLRIAAAGAVLTLWRRPWRAILALDRRGVALVAGLGAVLATMNTCFYLAIDRMPLATVAATEFVGPIVLALVASRTARNLGAVVAAAVGVYLLTHVRFVAEPVGVGFALANAALFMAYIVLAHRLARSTSVSGIDALAAAMSVALVVITPIGLATAAPALADPMVLGAGVAVGICSSVIPYVFDQLAMARLPRDTYALLVALLPATATIVGASVLAQLPSLLDLAGIALVVTAVTVHRQHTPSTRAQRAV